MANAPTEESIRHMPRLQIQNEIEGYSQQSQHSLSNPDIHGCYGSVVGAATTYPRGMTVPESKPTPTASNHRTGNTGRKHLGAHLPEENRSWILVNEHMLEEVTSRVNMCMWRRVNQCNWRWNDKWIQKTMIWIPRQVTASTLGGGVESIPGGKPASNGKWWVHRAKGWCQVYRQVHRLGGWSVQLQEHWKDDEKINLPNGITKDSHQTASRETVTEWHHEWLSPNGIMRDNCENYREMMTEHNDQDHSPMTPNWDWIRRQLGALHMEGTDWDVDQTAYWNGSRTTILEAYKRGWPMLKEHE